MRAWKMGIASAVLIAAVLGSTATAMAGGHHGGGYGYSNAASTASTAGAPAKTCTWTGACWRDADGDGIRDTWNGTCSDADGDGICDVCGQTVHAYADANGDGVCDHYAARGTRIGCHGMHRDCLK